ncbi:homeobox protein DLX-4 [Microtus oregoni]|uniref:homeobox protein DLX-4 n=1 Tax=Microtus oregoni TaxID=111838 RepID=UPI001BB23746|nr:homeobox protein DLX-4 [Microtus oregoni]
MTSLPCSLPGREASNVVFPDLAPTPSVVAAYPLGLSPETAASPDLSYSQPYGHLLPYSYPEPATPGDAYLPSQQLSAAWSQPFHPPVEHPQELETGKDWFQNKGSKQKKLLQQNSGEQEEDFSGRPSPCSPNLSSLWGLLKAGALPTSGHGNGFRAWYQLPRCAASASDAMSLEKGLVRLQPSCQAQDIAPALLLGGEETSSRWIFSRQEAK